MYAFTSLRVAEINCTRIAILTVSWDMEAFTVITDIRIPAADIYRTRVTIIAVHRRECTFTRNRVAGVFGAWIAVITRGHIGASSCKRIAVVQRAGVDIVAGWFM